MPFRFSNNASATLGSSLTSAATTLAVSTGLGALFPLPGVGEFFHAVLVDASNNIEIVKVTARSGDVMTIARGEEGTAARTFSSGDRFELRTTAAGLANMVQLDGAQTITGQKTFSQQILGSISGSAGSVTNGVYTIGNQTIGGQKTFSETIIGNLQGNVTGNAGSVTNGVYTAGDQTIGGNKSFSGLTNFTNGRVQVQSAGLAMYEMHLPGAHARAMYLSPDGVLRLATTNGAGVVSSVQLSLTAGGAASFAGSVQAAGGFVFPDGSSQGTSADSMTSIFGYRSVAMLMSTRNVNTAIGEVVSGTVLRYGFSRSSSNFADTYTRSDANAYNAGGSAPPGTWMKISNNPTYYTYTASTGGEYPTTYTVYAWAEALYIRVS
jgi:hypothetical protein